MYQQVTCSHSDCWLDEVHHPNHCTDTDNEHPHMWILVYINISQAIFVIHVLYCFCEIWHSVIGITHTLSISISVSHTLSISISFISHFGFELANPLVPQRLRGQFQHVSFSESELFGLQNRTVQRVSDREFGLVHHHGVHHAALEEHHWWWRRVFLLEQRVSGCECVGMCVCMCVCVRMCVCMSCVYGQRCWAYVCMRICVRMCACMCVCE